MAVTVISINYYSITQLRMAANHTDSIQIGYDMKAIVQEAVWKLTKNLFWRTSDSSSIYPTYNRSVQNSVVTGYTDAVTITTSPPGATQSFQRSFRYYIKEIPGLSLDKPEKIFMHPSGDILIADSENHKILRVNPETSAVTTIAGTGSSGNTKSGPGDFSELPKLDTPNGISTDPTGEYYYIADTENHYIRRVNWISDTIYHIEPYAGTAKQSGYTGDGGLATDAELDEPRGIFLDSAGNLYIADTNNSCIRMVDHSTRNITTVAGTGSSGYDWDGGSATSAKLNKPSGVFKDSLGNLFIADTENNRIRKVDALGFISTVVGTGIYGDEGDGGAATNAQLKRPKDVSVDEHGNIFIADTGNNKVRVVNAENNNIYPLAGTGQTGNTKDCPAVNALLENPSGIAMATSYSSRRIFISDNTNNTIKFLLFKIVPEL